MPRIKDLERFKRDLVALSRENEVLAQWGEVREDLPLPTTEGKAAPAPVPKSPVPRSEAAGTAPDFSDLLSNLPLEADPTAAPSSDAELDALLSLPAEEGTAVEGDSSADVVDGLDAATGGAEPGPGGEDDLADFLASIESMDVPDEGAVTPGAGLVDEVEISEGTGGGKESDDAPDFDLGAFAGAMEESALEEPAVDDVAGPPSLAEEPTTDDGFLDSLDTEEALPAVEEEAGAAAGSEDFTMPDLGDFDLPTEEAGSSTDAAVDAEFKDLDDSFAMPSAATETEADAVADIGAGDPGDSEAVETPAAPTEPVEDFDLGELESLGSLEESGTADEPAPEAALPAIDAEGDGEVPELGGDEFGIPDFGEAGTKAAAPEVPAFPSTGAPAAAEAAFEDPTAGLPGDIDAFESFSFDDPAAPGLAGEALDRELANLGEEGELAPTFSLEGSWNNFGASEQDDGPPPGAIPRTPPPRSSGRAEAGKPARALSLTEAQVDRLQDRLLALPLNLRVAVEDIVANEKGTEAQRSDLVWMLVENAKAEEIAIAAGKVLKRRIPVPEGYELRTGAGYLAERGSLRWLLVHTILPIARATLLVLLLAGALGYLGWRFVYKPLMATSLYRTGYERIAQGRYPEAEAAFVKATSIREFVVWYYRYAEAYAARKYYIYAENKYRSLLEGDKQTGIKPHPEQKEAALAWARLERDQLKYDDAIKILNNHVIDRKALDKEGLLLQGDVFLDWAEEDPAKFEDARKRYATLIQAYGTQDLYLERMLLYFMRSEKAKGKDLLSEVLPLKQRFLASKPVPLAASTLAELGGYLIDRGQLEDELHVLTLALERDPLWPETHWQLHRYYRNAGNVAEETKGLDNAIAGFERLPALDRRRLNMYIESLIRRGDLRLAGGQYLTAEKDFTDAVAAYDSALGLGRLKRTPAYGRAWAGLGDISYEGREDLAGARGFYEQAEAQGWDSAEIRYRRGFIDYRERRYVDALAQFWRSQEAGETGPRLLYAMGTTFVERSDWHAAEGYFRRLVDSLGDRLAAMDWPVPQERESDRDLVEVLMQSQNNLGVALYRLGDRTGNPKLRAQAVAAFTESSRLYDFLVRDARSLVAANAANLGYVNMLYALDPKRGIDLAPYLSISKDSSWENQKREALGAGILASPTVVAPKPAAEKPKGE